MRAAIVFVRAQSNTTRCWTRPNGSAARGCRMSVVAGRTAWGGVQPDRAVRDAAMQQGEAGIVPRSVNDDVANHEKIAP